MERSGFERLLAAVCAGEVGAIFAFEASRLARNGREWHTLLELCAVVDTVLIDTEAVYDPKFTNDRLLLGLKGTLSELELGLFRARSHAAIREKAKRGEFYGLVAAGYRKTRDGRLEKEPDLRVQRALEFSLISSHNLAAHGSSCAGSGRSRSRSPEKNRARTTAQSVGAFPPRQH